MLDLLALVKNLFRYSTIHMIVKPVLWGWPEQELGLSTTAFGRGSLQALDQNQSDRTEDHEHTGFLCDPALNNRRAATPS